MANQFDFLLTDDNELDIRDGDIVVAESTLQHTKHIVSANFGYYSQLPVLAGQIDLSKLGQLDRAAVRRIQTALKSDGQKVGAIIVNGDELDINTRY